MVEFLELPSNKKASPVFFRRGFVPKAGLEPASLAAYAPQTYVYTNSTTWACTFQLCGDNGSRTHDPLHAMQVL